jgi:hypothetical protein
MKVLAILKFPEYSNGKATLKVIANKYIDVWEYQLMEVMFSGKQAKSFL